MREIKFRAWDERKKKMFPIFELRWRTNHEFIGGGNTWFHNDCMAPAEDWSKEVMQFTGLYDKNGKEIYEFMEIDNKYRVEYMPPCYVLRDIVNGDIITIYDNKHTITNEYIPIS